MPTSQTMGEAGASEGPSASLPTGAAQQLADSLKSFAPESYAAAQIPRPQETPLVPTIRRPPPPPHFSVQPAPEPPLGVPQIDRQDFLSPPRVAEPTTALQNLRAWARHPNAGPALRLLGLLLDEKGGPLD